MIPLTSGEELIANQLANEFPGWSFWRARRRDGSPGSWMATRLDPAAGTDPTLMAKDIPDMRQQATQQKASAR